MDKKMENWFSFHLDYTFERQFHYVVYCLKTAYKLNRTLILYSNDWQYSKRGWENIFLPVYVSKCQIVNYKALPQVISKLLLNQNGHVYANMILSFSA